jgi:hypothetical protein
LGTIAHFDLPKIRSRYKCRYFVETGTGSGRGLEYARNAGFEKLFSIEIIPALAQNAQAHFMQDDRIKIFHGESRILLEDVLAKVPPAVPVLFWLDAHFPGADYGLAAYDAEKDVGRRLPLQNELETIRRVRPQLRDVIIIDDLRIYIDGPFSGGNIEEYRQTLPPEARNIDFVREFHATHTCQKIFDHEGYLLLEPRMPWWKPSFSGIVRSHNEFGTMRKIKDKIPKGVKAFIKKCMACFKI